MQLCTLILDEAHVQLEFGDKAPYSRLDAEPEIMLGRVRRDGLDHIVALLNVALDTPLEPLHKEGDFYYGVVKVGESTARVFDGGMYPWGKDPSSDPLDAALGAWCARHQVRITCTCTSWSEKLTALFPFHSPHPCAPPTPLLATFVAFLITPRLLLAGKWDFRVQGE